MFRRGGRKGRGHGVALAVGLHHDLGHDVTSFIKYLRERAHQLLKPESEISSFLT